MITLGCLLLSAANLQAQVSTHLWGIPWPATPDASEYADFDFGQVVEKYPGSAWLMEGNRYFYGVGGAERDFRKAMGCYRHAAEFSGLDEAVSDEVPAPDAAQAEPNAAEPDVADESRTDDYEEPDISGGEWVEDTTSVAEEGDFGNYMTLADGKRIWLAPASYLNHVLALCYAFGFGTAPDTEKAVTWGSNGEPDAWIVAGIALYRAQRYDEAYQLFESTAEESPYGRLWLTECKLRGRGTEADAKEAVRDLEAMAGQYTEQENPDLVEDICTRLSECYGQGIGTRPNTEKAQLYKERARKAAAMSSTQAFKADAI